ncbi:hypothetical protein N9E48_10265 [Paracoccaceae bacterium]|nr:hypothetical protein [Paracoccaceae bacterium]
MRLGIPPKALKRSIEMISKTYPENSNISISVLKLVLMSACILLSACIGADPDERFDAGYSDGYAVGYNTECKIRATLVEGDWEDPDYSGGYSKGLIAAADACKHSK